MIALRPLVQRQVEAVEIGAFERRHLIGDLVGFGTGLRNHLTPRFVADARRLSASVVGACEQRAARLDQQCNTQRQAA